jgi:hypothetical protein
MRGVLFLSSVGWGVGAATLTIVVIGGTFLSSASALNQNQALRPRREPTVRVGVVVAPVGVGVVVRVLVAGGGAIVAAAVVVALYG